MERFIKKTCLLNLIQDVENNSCLIELLAPNGAPILITDDIHEMTDFLLRNEPPKSAS